jgi:arginyl-tRNA--protein-N-Asp/Glu arginylyltransferase
MKTLATAPHPDFDVYIARADTRYAQREGEPLEALYEEGYLPYSGSRDTAGIFYSARSARVALQEFALTSENRRIARKFDVQFEKRRVPITELGADEMFYSFVLNYFTERHGPDAMPRERLELIIQSGLISDCLIYQTAEKVVGYVLEVGAPGMRHFWYSAYDLDLAKQSLGLWLMLDCIRDAKEAGLAHYYLGTVYGQKALYKTNFEPLEWHDGTAWSRDLGLLKEKSRTEE